MYVKLRVQEALHSPEPGLLLVLSLHAARRGSSHHSHQFFFRRAVRVTGSEAIYSPLVWLALYYVHRRTNDPERPLVHGELNATTRVSCATRVRAERRTPFRVPHTMPCECVAEDPAHGESQKSREGRPLVESKRNAGQGAGFSEPQDLLAAAAGDPCRVVLERDHRLLGFVLELEGLDLSAATLGSEVRACAS